MKLKEIAFWVILVVWVIIAVVEISNALYVRSLGCDKLLYHQQNNGSISSICDANLLRAYQQTLNSCANLSVIK
jgi:hypothetical protein